MKYFGIDVSEHNGKIDWKQMKAAGVQFAMIRSSWGHFQVDEQFENNVKGCEEAGVPYGLYHYSYVANDTQMKEEAAGFLKLCQSCKPSYPCAIDMEDADGWKKQQGVDDAQNIQTCAYTCEALENAGYYAAIYANLDWLQNHINSSKLDGYDKWVAQWASATTYSKPYGMWQYTSDGTLKGHDGRLDLNYAYKDYPTIIKEKGLNGWSTGVVSKPSTPATTATKHKKGDHVSFSGLWTQSNGGTWYPVSQLAVSAGMITKVLSGTKHPYLIDDNIGWANDDVVVSLSYKVNDKVSVSGLWTQSNGGTYYPKSQLAITSGKITKIIKGAEHPYLIGSDTGWAAASDIEKKL